MAPKGKSPGKYAREELIEQQFAHSLGQITIDDEVMKWIVAVMKKSTAEGRKKREGQIKALAQKKQRLEERLEKMCLDKLDGIISEDEYRRLSNKFRSELTDIKFEMEKSKQEKGESIDSAERLLELAQKASSLYVRQVSDEKRKLLNLVYSNSTFGSGELRPNFRKPFDLLAESSREYQRKKVTSLAKSDLSEIWRPLPDLNRCRRRERAVSWAGLDEGDVCYDSWLARRSGVGPISRERIELIPHVRFGVNIFLLMTPFFSECHFRSPRHSETVCGADNVFASSLPPLNSPAVLCGSSGVGGGGQCRGGAVANPWTVKVPWAWKGSPVWSGFCWR